MQKHSNYPLPLVGALQCDYVGYDLSCEGIGKETAMNFSIQSIPTVILIKNGEVVNKFVGMQSKEAFSAALDETLA